MKPILLHEGKFNDQYHLAPTGEDSPLNIDMAGTTRPNPDFYIKSLSPESMTLSFYQLEYVLEGKIFIESEGKKYSAEAGEMFFINKAVPRVLYSDRKTPVKKIFVTVKGPLIDGIVKAYKLKSPVIISKTDVEKYFRNILDILQNSPYYTPVVRDSLGAEILKIIQTVSRDLNLIDNIIEKEDVAENIIKYIDENLDRKITIEDLSQNFFLGKTQLIKLFKEKYQMTPMKYAQLQRIELAKYYLQATDTPISRMHELIGFDDVKYFSKLFKKSTGISPREYRLTRRNLHDPVTAGKYERLLRQKLKAQKQRG